MKIGIYVEHARDARPTGIGLHIRNLLDALAALDRTNQYLLYYPRDPKESQEEAPWPRQANFRARPVTFPVKWRNDHPTLWWKYWLPLVLRWDRIDVFHGPNYYLPAIPRKKNIVTIHDLAFFHMNVHGDAFDAVLRKWTLASMERAARVIALSENTRRDIEALGIERDRMRVIYGGGHWVSDDRIANERREELRRAFHLPERYVLFVGTLQPRKNVPFLLRAFAWLKRETGLPHGLVLVGQRDASAADLDRLIEELGIAKDVIITGYVQDWQLPLLYKLADVFVLPTLYEGFTLVTLEAMAYGIPVIATDTSSIREGTGDAAVLVPVNDDEALARALHTVLTDDAVRQQLIARGREQAKKFTWEECARQTLALYEEVYREARGERSRTLVVSENFPPKVGGSGRWLWELYRRLPRRAYAIAAGEDARAADFDRTHDLRVFRLPLTMRTRGMVSLHGFTRYIGGIRRLLRLVRRERVRVLHCGRCLPEGWMALAVRRLTGVPYLLFVHGEEMNTASTSRELTWMARRVLAGARLIIANSRNTQDILRHEWAVPAEKIRVLHPGVDTRRFVLAPRDEAMRAALGWGTRPVLLTVGRLQKRKGHDQLIAALPAVRERFPDVLYSIIGDGEERSFLENLTEQKGLTGHVQFLGEVTDEELIRCYQQCDLFVLPNRQVGRDIEGFGMVLLEAQACGKPVVAGSSGGTAETMRVPESGRVVPCDGPDALAATLIELLADRPLLERMGHAGRAWVEERFDWDVLARQAVQLFQQ